MVLMKRIIRIIILFILLIHISVFAKEKCSVVSGNGNDIGSEINCGGEHFYIIENKNDSLRLIAKYNLDMGYEYNKITVSEERFNELKTLYQINSNGYTRWSTDLFREEEFQGYDYLQYSNNIDSFVVFKYIDGQEVKQNEKAIGAHGDTSGQPEFPEYGVIDLWTVDIAVDEPYGGNYYADFDPTDFILFQDYNGNDITLDSYYDYLDDLGIEIKNIDLLSVKDLDNIVKKLSNKTLPLETWWEEGWDTVDGPHGHQYWIVGSIKEYLPEGYDWLYSTTYWTKTVVPEEAGYDTGLYAYFVDTLGNLCSTEQCQIAIGAGVRPVIEIDKTSIIYNIYTKTDGNGTIEVIDKASGGDNIKFKATPKKGYKLDSITITSDSGEVIKFTEEEITKDESGVLSVSLNAFTMPFENVTIVANWEKEVVNPNTTDIVLTAIVLLLISVLFIFIMKDIKKKELKKSY